MTTYLKSLLNSNGAMYICDNGAMYICAGVEPLLPDLPK